MIRTNMVRRSRSRKRSRSRNKSPKTPNVSAKKLPVGSKRTGRKGYGKYEVKTAKKDGVLKKIWRKLKGRRKSS